MSQSIPDKISRFAADCAASVKTGVKLALQSRRPTLPHVSDTDTPLVVLGNGPSLRTNLSEDTDTLKRLPCMAVNFFANAPEFTEIKPRYYVLADPHFFENASTDPNVARLIDNLRKVSWPMILLVPAQARGAARLFNGSAVKVCRFNFLAAEGFKWLEDAAFSSGRGMPRPRNVLIPAIMCGLQMGYRKILLLGADHSWLSTLAVADDNTVVSVQPHFYGDDKTEKARVQSVYRDVRLHEVLESMTIAFRSYHTIKRYCDKIAASVVNLTPGSMIDAFPRADIKDFKNG